jgi:gluconolactonase
VVRFEYDGSITVLASHYQGKRLNSPNDVVVKSDGSIWFTDPPFGTYAFYEGEKVPAELPATNTYRVDPQSGEVTCVCDDVNHPNGLAFSPDESVLYVIASRAEPRAFIAYDVAPDGKTLRNRREFITCRPGETPDGFRVDLDGNLWCGWGMTPEFDGVRVFNQAGAPIGHIHLPERAANLCFGGRHRNRLFIAAAQSLYSLYVNTQGVAGG